ncbi:hypothetical protein [Tsuneonella sp. HG222]
MGIGHPSRTTGRYSSETGNVRADALGLSVRPFATISMRAAAEVRISDTAAGSEVRPAAYAVTELPPLSLPGGWQAEAYAQAGYVGGRFATGFVDGQARLDRKILSPGMEGAELRAGLAAWGGAQKGAARLDIGPTASLGFRLGDARSRLAVDYRFRVAGEAEPKSGPAVTLSAGF